MQKYTVPLQDRHVGDLQSQQRVNISSKDKQDIPMNENEFYQGVNHVFNAAYKISKDKGHTDRDATRIARSVAEEKYNADWGKVFCREEEPREKILMKKGIIDMQQDSNGVLTFQDLAEIRGFSGDISLDVVYTPESSRHKKVSVWTECSELAVECLEELSREMVISIVPVVDTMQVIRLYGRGRTPILPMLTSNVIVTEPNQPCWLPCVVCKGQNFDDYAEEIYNYFGELAC